ncbi:hypothetical protein G7Z17_g8762 [Cylindrodendrum hubeiense]|uniref:lytic cellulose monooxygenase (C4-dehydrogenating) n=1 Tax=Cylindrodendrum hubeiense TaxID=595255 RepID=A0A9P5LE06_9HYPO|nr:hypothetical protein G7Z17_g8762 [Cylindrodendrum hubeiense]
MRSFGSLVLASMAVSMVSAHYTFSGLLVNGQLVGDEFQYVREHTRGYMPSFREEAATSEDFRCNQGALSGNNTDVYTVKAGDVVGLRQAFGAGGIEHPGPTQLYLSKAPDSVKDYDGSGDWIKVHQGLICKENPVAEDLQNDGWCIWGENHISFTVPDTIPDGEYLLRAEHIALHGAHVGRAEFYYACAQIKVEGSSASSLPSKPSTKIPGVYAVDDEAINFSIWAGLTAYPYSPGIDVANGGQIRGTADGSTGDATVDVTDNDSAAESLVQTSTPVAASSAATAFSTVIAVASSTSIASASTIESSVISQPSSSRCRLSRRRSVSRI